MDDQINEINCWVADWKQDQDILSDLRRQVFIDEQHVPEEMEWDDFDEDSTHYSATHENKVVAVARLKPDGQLGRMAVKSEYRNLGIGSRLLKFILEDIKKRKLDGIYLHAQVSAVSFYRRQGFITQGNIFYEADIAHQKMVLAE